MTEDEITESEINKQSSRKDVLEEVPSIDEKDSGDTKNSQSSSEGTILGVDSADSPQPRKKGRLRLATRPELFRIQS